MMKPKPQSSNVSLTCILGALCLIWPTGLSAHENNYPFDYDPELSEDPDGISAGLQTLHNSLPGLPDGLVEIEMGGIQFNYFPETLDMIQRALDSGPAIVPPMERVSLLCAEHDAFVLPAFVIEPASEACRAAGQEVLSAFDGSFDTCQEVEFPEVYVLDHPPAVVDANFLGQSRLLSTLEGQIALIGEALSHLDYPVGLIPESFWPLARSVIAKIRYDTLSDNINARLALYERSDARLRSSASCFHSEESQFLQSSIDALIVELTYVQEHLDQIYDDGLAQAEADRLAVENEGRLRNDLPHPALTDHEREMMAFYLAAIYWRMRGGGLIRNPDNGDIPDITYVTNIFAGIARFTGGVADPAGVGYRYAVDESAGYAEWWDMGNEPGHDQYYDLWRMTDRGRRGVNMASTMVGNWGYDTRNMIAGGLIMGPCYYYMWYELWARNDRYFQLGEDLVTPYFLFCEMPVSTGEVCYGGAMGLGLARTLLWGRPNPDCQPNCDSRECGTNGCGGSCGTCDGDAACENGTCVHCEPDCTSRECGDDGCDGTCGTCGDDEACENGTCVHCEPDCTSRECGDNGCGGSCGTCDDDQICEEGSCEPGGADGGVDASDAGGDASHPPAADSGGCACATSSSPWGIAGIPVPMLLACLAMLLLRKWPVRLRRRS